MRSTLILTLVCTNFSRWPTSLVVQQLESGPAQKQKQGPYSLKLLACVLWKLLPQNTTALSLQFPSCTDVKRDGNMAEHRPTGSTWERAKKSRCDRGIFETQHFLDGCHPPAQPMHLPSGSLKIKEQPRSICLRATVCYAEQLQGSGGTYTYIQMFESHWADWGGCIFLCAPKHASLLRLKKRLQH